MISVVMPAHNEEGYLRGAIEAVVSGLGARGEPFEVVVAENGSVDATADEAAEMAKMHPQVSVITDAKADYGRALRRGFLATTGDLIVNFDVDLVDMDFLDRALEVLTRPEVAAVVGSKRAHGAHDERSIGRKLVTGVFGLIMRYGFGLRVSDTHGLKALRRAPLAPLVDRCQFGAEIFDTELILRAERAGLLVTEIPVTISDQRPPRTRIARRIPRTLVGLFRLRLALWRSDGRKP